MLLHLLIVTLLYIREGNTQECHYDVIHEQNAVSCVNITTNEQLREEIDNAFSPYGNVTWVIDIFELLYCDMLDFQINEVSFLSQLQQIQIIHSTVRTLSSGNPDEAMNDNVLCSQRIIESNFKENPIGRYVVSNLRWRSITITDEKTAKSDTSSTQIVLDIGELSVLLGHELSIETLPDLGQLPLSLLLGILGMPGCIVIGIAGDDKKGKWLVDELGFDHFINNKRLYLAKTLAQYAPSGVDRYFDNVGG
ncbi:hypothetical protein ILUMI_05992 [Ignelater luminosus]|uniref:Uncharacterized protein n=1 Tax=Ignelater luminosus TaxID=2038154 RepID=A0A8K0DAX0_IGNLU|nr:hypothetical protein ILUMI_05992 [Ignelater luminosus]